VAASVLKHGHWEKRLELSDREVTKLLEGAEHSGMWSFMIYHSLQILQGQEEGDWLRM
jgi:hypothetical protein